MCCVIKELCVDKNCHHNLPDLFTFASALFKYRSVPKHGAKNILPLAARFTVLTAMRSHITTHTPVKTYKTSTKDPECTHYILGCNLRMREL
jgi:hypothetical protein